MKDVLERNLWVLYVFGHFSRPQVKPRLILSQQGRLALSYEGIGKNLILPV
jgi:hypothetical protein